MSYNANGVRELAMLNKRNLKNKFFMVPINGEEYKFKISGLGKMAIKIEKYFYYNEIVKYISDGKKGGFEYLIGQLVVDPKNQTKIPHFEGTFELRERALINKANLKSKYVNILIGSKEYGFRLSGIGNKSVKIELFVGYDDIVKELTSGNNNSLEFILMELLLGNEIDYDKFNETPIIIEVDDDEEDEEEDINEIDLDNIEKLSREDFEDASANVSGWSKLVFDAIDDFIEDIFTFELLLNQDRILSYQTRGETLENDVLDNLNKLIELGLVAKLNKTYYARLW